MNLKKGLFIAAFLTPIFIFSAGPLIYPSIDSLHISLLDLKPMERIERFVGIKNYIDIFFDELAIQAFRNTLYFGVMSVTGTILISIAAALILNEDFKGNKICLVLLLIPWSISGVASGVMWRSLFSYYGVVNDILLKLGFSRIDWFGNPQFILYGVTLTSIYKNMPFVALLFFAVLQTIPREIIEATEIDGASSFRRFKYITLPYLKFPLFASLVYMTANIFKTFDMIFIWIGGAQFVTSWTRVLYYYSYEQSFELMNFGYGSAIGWVVGIAVIFLAIIYKYGLKMEL